jgi:hypothetical protein
MNTIMKRRIILCLLVTTLSLAGCLNTFYPIYRPENLVWNDNIPGTWQFENQQVIIEKLEDVALLPKPLLPFKDKVMLVRDLNEKNVEAGLDIALLVKIGDYYFLDRFPVLNDAEKKLNPLYSSLFLRQHSVYRVDSFETGNKLFLQRVSDNRLKEQIEQKKIRIETIQREDGSLILASTEELQKHIIKYAGDKSFYENDNSHSFRRINKN